MLAMEARIQVHWVTDYRRKDITPVKKVDEETKEERVEYECLMRFLTIKQWMEELEKEKQLLGVQMSEREIQEISQGQQISNLEIKLLELQGGM